MFFNPDVNNFYANIKRDRVYCWLKKKHYPFKLLSSLEPEQNIAKKITHFYVTVMPVIALQMKSPNNVACWPCFDKKCQRLHRYYTEEKDYISHQLNTHGNMLPGFGSFLLRGNLTSFCFTCREGFSDTSIFLMHRFYLRSRCYHSAIIIRHEYNGKKLN